MPKETKAEVEARARELGYPISQAVQAEDGGWYLAPRGVTSAKAKRAYADCRMNNGEKGTCAAVAHKIQDEEQHKNNECDCDLLKAGENIHALENQFQNKCYLKVLSQDDDRSFLVELRVLRSGVNGNKWDYQNVEKYAKTFAGTPILCAFPNGKIGDKHNYEIKVNPRTGQKYYSFVGANSERPVGAISENPDDIYTQVENGETWVYAKGKLWYFYNQELVEKIVTTKMMQVSAETDVNQNTLVENPDGTQVFYDWTGYGVTILGDGVQPAIPTANIKTLAAFKDAFSDLKLRVASLDISELQDQDDNPDININSNAESEPESDDEENGDSKSKEDKGMRDKLKGKDEEPDDDSDDDNGNDNYNKGKNSNSNSNNNNEPQSNTDINKGVKPNMAKSTKAILKELQAKFENHYVLSYTEDLKTIGLMSKKDNSLWLYTVNDDDDGKIIDKRFSPTVGMVTMSLNDAVKSEFDLDDIIEKANANNNLAQIKINELETKLAAADEARTAAETKCTAMENAEMERRKECAKLAVNAQRDKSENKIPENEKVPTEKFNSIIADIDSGLYNNSVDASGKWNGDEKARKDYLSEFGEVITNAQELKISQERVWKFENNNYTQTQDNDSSILDAIYNGAFEQNSQS